MRRRGLRGAIAASGGKGLNAARLGELTTVEDAQRWLRTIAQAVAEKRLTHNEGRTMTGAVREWIRAEDIRLRAVDLEELRGQLAELKRRGGLRSV